MLNCIRRGAVFATLLALACGGDDGPSGPITDASFIGTWNLRTISGERVPFPIAQTAEHKLEVRSGKVIIGADRSFRDEQVIRLESIGQAPRTDTLRVEGTWTRVDDMMTVTVGASGTINLLLINNQLLKQESGFTYNYRK